MTVIILLVISKCCICTKKQRPSLLNMEHGPDPNDHKVIEEEAPSQSAIEIHDESAKSMEGLDRETGGKDIEKSINSMDSQSPISPTLSSSSNSTRSEGKVSGLKSEEMKE